MCKSCITHVTSKPRIGGCTLAVKVRVGKELNAHSIHVFDSVEQTSDRCLELRCTFRSAVHLLGLRKLRRNFGVPASDQVLDDIGLVLTPHKTAARLPSTITVILKHAVR